MFDESHDQSRRHLPNSQVSQQILEVRRGVGELESSSSNSLVGELCQEPSSSNNLLPEAERLLPCAAASSTTHRRAADHLNIIKKEGDKKDLLLASSVLVSGDPAEQEHEERDAAVMDTHPRDEGVGNVISAAGEDPRRCVPVKNGGPVSAPQEDEDPPQPSIEDRIEQLPAQIQDIRAGMAQLTQRLLDARHSMRRRNLEAEENGVDENLVSDETKSFAAELRRKGLENTHMTTLQQVVASLNQGLEESTQMQEDVVQLLSELSENQNLFKQKSADVIKQRRLYVESARRQVEEAEDLRQARRELRASSVEQRAGLRGVGLMEGAGFVRGGNLALDLGDEEEGSSLLGAVAGIMGDNSSESTSVRTVSARTTGASREEEGGCTTSRSEASSTRSEAWREMMRSIADEIPDVSDDENGGTEDPPRCASTAVDS